MKEYHDLFVEFVTFHGDQFTYTGRTPEVTYTNNYTFMKMDVEEMPKNVGQHTVNFRAQYSNGLTVNIPYTYTINKAMLDIEVHDAERKYGDMNPDFTYTITGFVNGENESVFQAPMELSASCSPTSNVGTYKITLPDHAAIADNYSRRITRAGTLTVKKAHVVVKVNDRTKQYGDDDPQVTFTYEGLKNNETDPNLIEDFEAYCYVNTEEVGIYSTYATGGLAKNYEFTFQPGKLSVTPAPLTIEAQNSTRVYGNENAPFKFTYSGFKNNDTIEDLTRLPEAETEAQATSDVGLYDIVPCGAEAKNYSFIYKKGVLTIEKASQEILWDQDLEGVPVGSQIELTATTTSGLRVEYEVGINDVAGVYESGGKYYLDCYGLGEVYIRAKQEGDRNYYSAVRVSKKLLVGDPNGLDEITEQPSSVTVENRKIKVSGAKSSIQVYDLSGRLVMDVEPTGDLTVIELSDAGTFIVRTKTMRTKVVLW